MQDRLARRPFIAAVLALAAAPARAAERPKVVATFSVLGDMIIRISGDKVLLTTIVGGDGDCELYQPTAADARAVAEAQLFVMNDLNPRFEPWAEHPQVTKRTSYVIAKDGRIAMVHDDLDWSQHVAKTLAAVKALKGH